MLLGYLKLYFSQCIQAIAERLIAASPSEIWNCVSTKTNSTFEKGDPTLWFLKGFQNHHLSEVLKPWGSKIFKMKLRCPRGRRQLLRTVEPHPTPHTHTPKLQFNFSRNGNKDQIYGLFPTTFTCILEYMHVNVMQLCTSPCVKLTRSQSVVKESTCDAQL